MNYEKLIESAGKIPTAKQEAISEYQNKMELLIAEINREMTSRADLKDLIGKLNVQTMKSNHVNHVLFINSILKIPNPEVLVDTILWVFKTYQSRGFTANYWNAQINAWFDILKKQLSREPYVQIIPLYEWMHTNIPLFESLSTEKKNEGILNNETEV